MTERFAKDLVLEYQSDDYTAGRMNACAYCGSTISMTRDHVIPVSWSRPGRDYAEGDTVKCCGECNTTLSNLNFFSIESRAQYLLGVYSKKYAKIAKTPEWSDIELQELDHGLRKKVEASKFEKEFLIRRLSHLTNVIGDSPEVAVRQVAIDHAKAYRAFTSAFAPNEFRSVRDFQKSYDEKHGDGCFRKFLNSSEFYCTRIQWLYDNKFKLDLEIKQILAAAFKSKRGGK